MTTLTDEDLSGIIDRAVGRWLRASADISYRCTGYGSEFRSAAMNLKHTGDAICDLLKDRKPLYANDVTHLVGRWRERGSTLEKEAARPRFKPDLRFAIDFVAAGTQLVELLQMLPLSIPQCAASVSGDAFVERVRAELWAPGKLPTPESVAAFVEQAVAKTLAGAVPVELALQTVMELFAKRQGAGGISILNGCDAQEAKFFADLLVELARAKRRYPDPRGRLAALTSEVGELATALLRESPEDAWKEAVQVAVVALRIATEGDPSVPKTEKAPP